MLKPLKKELPQFLGIGVVTFDFIFLLNLFHQQVEKRGVPFSPQRALIPVGYIWWRRTGARPIHFEVVNIALVRWCQFQKVSVVGDIEERIDMAPTKSLKDGMSACGLNSEVQMAIKLTRASVLPSSRDRSTGTLKTREIAGERLGVRLVLSDICPLDIISHNLPT